MRFPRIFCAPLCRAHGVTPMREALESLQQALGGANDCAVAAVLLRKLRAAPRSVPALRNVAKLSAHRKDLRTAWKAYRAARKAWE